MTQLKSRIPSLTKPDEEIYNDVTIKERRFYQASHMRKNEVLTDIVLITEGKRLPAHKFVLAASSDYFLTLFTSPLGEKKDVFELHGVSGVILDDILNYLYTGAIDLSVDNIQDILHASCLLLLNSLRDRCAKFLKERIELHNCLGIFSIAKSYSLYDLYETALAFISISFLDVINLEEYKELSLDLLLDILKLENLSVSSEDYVFEAARVWLNVAPLERKTSFPTVLKSLHLPYVSDTLLRWVLDSDSVISRDSALTRLVESALSYDVDQWSVLPQDELDCESDLWVFPRKCIEYIPCVIAMGGPTLSIYNMELDRWFELTKCKPRHCPAMDVLGKSIYVVGGSLEWKRKASGEKYDIEKQTWTSIANMTTPRSNFGLLEHKGKLYALGGYDGNFPLRSGEVYDPSIDRWSDIPNMSSARDGACNVSDGENIYVIGGYDGSKYLKTVECFNDETCEWSTQDIPPAHIKRQNAISVYYNGCIYYMGGYFEDTYHASLEVLDLDTKTWSFLTPLPEPRHHTGAAAINGYIFVCGGWSGQIPVVHVDIYSINDNDWRRVAQLPTPTMIRCAAVNFPRKAMLKLIPDEDNNEMTKLSQGQSIEVAASSFRSPRISESSNDDSAFPHSL